jgi:hypothetical protein
VFLEEQPGIPGPGYKNSDTAAIAAQLSRKATPMLRSKMGLVVGGVAAVAMGIVGGWTLLKARSAQASISTATIMKTTASPSADEAAPPAPAPARAANPAPVAPPPRVAAAPAPAPDATSAGETGNKPRIRLDGERSEISFDGDEGSLHVNKDRMSVRTPLGKFEIKW